MLVYLLHDMCVLLCCFNALVLTAFASMQCEGMATKDCVEVKHLCTDRVGCSMAWHNYQIHCRGTINGDVQTCTVSCQRATTVLLSGQDGIGRWFTNCSCTGEEVCREQQRLKFCGNFILQVLETLDDSVVIGCSSARIMCEADAACHTAFQMYMSQCESMFESGLDCTKECEDSLRALYEQKRAAKLKYCVCDNDDEYTDCKNIHRKVDTICNYRNNTYKLVHSSGSRAHVHLITSVLLSFVQILIVLLLRK